MSSPTGIAALGLGYAICLGLAAEASLRLAAFLGEIAAPSIACLSGACTHWTQWAVEWKLAAAALIALLWAIPAWRLVRWLATPEKSTRNPGKYRWLPQSLFDPNFWALLATILVTVHLLEALGIVADSAGILLLNWPAPVGTNAPSVATPWYLWGAAFGATLLVAIILGMILMDRLDDRHVHESERTG